MGSDPSGGAGLGGSRVPGSLIPAGSTVIIFVPLRTPTSRKVKKMRSALRGSQAEGREREARSANRHPRCRSWDLGPCLHDEETSQCNLRTAIWEYVLQFPELSVGGLFRVCVCYRVPTWHLWLYPAHYSS